MSIRVGLDVGGVIVKRSTIPFDVSEDTDLAAVAGEDRAMPGVFDAVREIVSMAAGVYIVSRGGEAVQRRTRAWLEAVDFYARTGLTPDNVHFVRSRDGKVPVCERLGVTHFVDDRIDVLESMRHSVSGLILFANAEVVVPKWARRARGWAEVLELLQKPPPFWRSGARGRQRGRRENDG